MPKLTLWKDGGPKLFKKKEKDLGPVPQHFQEETAIAKSESGLQLDPGDVVSPNERPSGLMQPERALGSLNNRSNPSTNEKRFETPLVAGSSTSGQPAEREPYKFDGIASSNSLKNAAEKLNRDFKNLNSNDETQFDRSFGGIARSTPNEPSDTQFTSNANQGFSANNSLTFQW
ncbi:MAG: hypothetical protein R3C03_19290 [Pirellulaceae bacterium]